MALTLSEVSMKLQEAVGHQNEGRLEAATALYDAILADEDALLASDATPGNQAVAVITAVYNNLGSLRLVEGHVEEARVAFRRALDLAPGNLDTLTNLALVKRYTGNRAGAVEGYKQALEIEENYLPALVGLAQTYGELGQFEKGEQLLQRATARLPGELGLKAELANILIPIGRGKDALQIIEQALAVNPDHFGALTSKAKALQLVGELDEAIMLLEKLVSRQPENAILLNALGLAEQRRGNEEAAAACFQKAMLASPGFEQPYSNLAALHEQHDQIEDAKKITEEGLKRFPDSRHFLLLTVRFTRRDGDYSTAMTILDTLPMADSDDQISYQCLLERAELYRQLANESAAKECDQRARELRNRYPGLILEYSSKDKDRAKSSD